MARKLRRKSVSETCIGALILPNKPKTPDVGHMDLPQHSAIRGDYGSFFRVWVVQIQVEGMDRIYCAVQKNTTSPKNAVVGSFVRLTLRA
ncbi:hypothetical protein WG66_013699 [Moniliophthora roreri]|nr:hypothetical protein WG66_013699 [Moniliophthora roreri]